MKLFILAQLILLGFEFSPDFSTNGDDAKYYLLGKSLFSGNGYRDLFDPQNPVQSFYPPLFPGLIGFTGMFSDSPMLPKMVIGVISACVILLLFYYVRPLGSSVLIPLLLVSSLSFSFASHATLLMSEIPYLFATLASLLLLEGYRRRGGLGGWFWAAAIVSVTPTFIRTVGITFSAAWIVTTILDKRYKQAAAHALLLIAGMMFLRYLTEGNGSYADALFSKNLYDPELGLVTVTDLVSRVGQNVSLLFFSLLPRSLLGIPLTRTMAITASFLLLIPAFIGWIRNFRLPTRFVSFYVFFYLGMISFQQTQWVGERFLIPLIPFLALFLFLGLETIMDRIVPSFSKPVQSSKSLRMKGGVLWFAAIGITVINFSGHLQSIKMNTGLPGDWKNFYSCADWIRLNTPSDAIVVNRKPELFYLRAQRKGFVYPFSHDVEKVIAGLQQGNARYCVLDNFSWTNTSARYLFPAILSHPERFKVVYSLRNPDTYILEFRSP
ncbi:MAG: hypothetical protein JXA71_15260 [Chitinispirillaceae bacterium]|nr:hypothetical protein [Chitinispirillaceae bacterium]